MVGVEPSPGGVGVVDFVGVLRRRWLLVAACVTVGALIPLALALTSPVNSVATADVLIEQSITDPQSSPTRVLPEEVATQVQVVTSLPVARIVAEELSLANPPDLSDFVRVQAVGNSRILRISASDSDPDRAALNANTVASAYLTFREADLLDRYQRRIETLALDQAELETRFEQLDAQLAADNDPADAQTLQIQQRALLIQLGQISTQIDELATATAVYAGGTILRSATSSPASAVPGALLNLAVGGIFGLMVGASAALLLERNGTRRSRRSPADTEGASDVDGARERGLSEARAEQVRGVLFEGQVADLVDDAGAVAAQPGKLVGQPASRSG